jgi:hypothetical protein
MDHAGLDKCKAATLRWAYDTFKDNDIVRKIAVNYVVIVFDLGLIAEDDSDYTII